jgi:poly-gamma-glutamate capsule biosynthesis protein CapA/YwtB (metallophosphatase superfamily)
MTDETRLALRLVRARLTVCDSAGNGALVQRLKFSSRRGYAVNSFQGRTLKAPSACFAVIARGAAVLALVGAPLFQFPSVASAQVSSLMQGGAQAQEGMGRAEPRTADRANAPSAHQQPNPLMPAERELAMKIKGPFTLTAVGDLILRTPIAQLGEPAFQNLVKHIRDADVGFANMEGPLIDQDNYPYSIGGVGFGGAPKSALATIKSMGVKIMSTANNMQMDADITGMLETIRMLNEGGIVYAGTGRNLEEARSARFLGTPKGVVGLVSAWSMDSARRDGATYRIGNSGGHPGLNALHVTMQGVVTAEQMEQLRKIRDSIYARRGEVFAPVAPAPADERKDRLELFNQRFAVGPKPGDLHYTMQPDDLREILRSIRDAKQYSDFMIATVHCHQGNYAFQTYTYDNDTPDFLIDFAHKAIDNGADIFVGHGVHTLRGVEIYKGKPIFYGVNTFIYQYQWSLPQNSGGDMTDAEELMLPGGFAGSRVTQAERMEALLTESHFENGQLTEVRLYPVDLGQDLSRPFSRTGIPMIPSPDMAERVLEKIQRLSKPFGTKIVIENGVGVIRISGEQSQVATP